MRAIWIEQPRARWRIAEIQTPRPGPGEVLVRVCASGLCGADLEITRGEYPLACLPLTPGHEVAGMVDEVGTGVTDFQSGNHVGLGWLQGVCGKCEPCLEGEEILCANQRTTGVNMDGGHAEYVLARADYLHRLPDGLPFEEAAALMCPGMTAYSALKLGGLRPGGRVAVLGLGGVGHLAVQYAKAMGAEVVLLTRGGQEKLSLANKLGADQALDFRDKGAGHALQEIGGVELLLAASVSARDTSEAIRGLKPNGTMILIGVPSEPIPVPADPMCAGRRRIIGLPSGGRVEVREAAAFAVRVGIHPMVETYALEDAQKALDRMEQSLVRFRAVLVP